MKILKTIGLTLALASALTASVQAATITGKVAMSGTVFLDNTMLGSADAATAFAGVTVGGIPTGTFAGTGGSSVTWSPFNWADPILPPTLWTYTSGATTYSFKLESVSVFSQNNSFLNLLGSGTLAATGFTPTHGSWSFTISNPGGSASQNFDFTFANSQTAVPDGGATAMLLGVGLLGLGALRRKLS